MLTARLETRMLTTTMETRSWLQGQRQRVQNKAAGLVLGRRGRDHAKPLLRSLHWLPVWFWIEYKIPPCAIVAEILLVLPTCLVFSLSTFPLSAFCRHWTHYIKLNKYGKRALILMHTTCDLDFPFQTSTWCSKFFVFQIQSENVPLRKHLYWGHSLSDPPGCWAKLIVYRVSSVSA